MYQSGQQDDIIVIMDDIKSVRAPRGRASGRFLLRLSPGLHAALRRAAFEANVSLNDYCARKLAAPAGDLSAIEGAAHAVDRAAALFGERLVGVAAFGSWARRQTADGSDLDLLVVVDPAVDLTRDLYRKWDEEAVDWEGRTVEPHFAHLPDEDRVVGGLWAEVALDGIVLFERALAVSKRLVSVRRDIVAGKIVRRVAHGQPYWAEVA
jgi:predicted nucleotidyltransferase